jgi:hypothetical protein
LTTTSPTTTRSTTPIYTPEETTIPGTGSSTSVNVTHFLSTSLEYSSTLPIVVSTDKEDEA